MDEESPIALFKRMSEKRRTQTYEMLYEEMPIEEVTDSTQSKYPILIEENYYQKETKENLEEKKALDEFNEDVGYEESKQLTGGKKMQKDQHLFILVHGMGGSHGDMRQIMNEIALISP